MINKKQQVDNSKLRIAIMGELCHLVSVGAIDMVKINVEQFTNRIMCHVECAPARERESGDQGLLKALDANDTLIRDIRHRDARWHDDEMVTQILDANTRILNRRKSSDD